MTQRKPKLPQAATPNEVQGRDLFQTPNYAVDLLIPFIPKHITHIWECAAGEGKICERLDPHYVIFRTDIRADNVITRRFNFLTEAIDLAPEYSWAIITNPPFSLKKQFYERCMKYGIPFALLIPADYSRWIIKAIQEGAEKIIPTRRIDYITPNGKSGKLSSSLFHSMWLTWGFNLGRSETFVELSKQMKENI